LISREEARQRVLDGARHLPTVTVALENALGRVLGEDVCSDVDLPPFRKSSMDGYACRAEDAFHSLRVLEHIPAGQMPTHPITQDTCSKIMTGAPVPDGADCILIVEEVEELEGGSVQFTGKQPKSNICPQGEDINVGDCVLTAGTRLAAAHLPVLASVGAFQPRVSTRPRVAVMATGDELVPPSEKPPPGKIRNSNSVQLCALATGAGGKATDLGIVADDRASMVAAWERALEDHDVVFSTGGVSMGDYDFVPDILKHHGFEILVERVAIQPGKPVLFARRGDKACFGLSGNPASSYLQFILFAAPFLWKLQGHDYHPPKAPLLLGHTFTRKNGGREGWVPVRIDSNKNIQPVDFHGSAHIHAFSAADGLIAFPVGETSLAAGKSATVRFLSD
jgi:molybdopterin molybdotransferase